MECRYSYIAFEGPTGSETKKLARMAADTLHGDLVEDLRENPFLADFYKDKNGAAFQTQLFYLLNRSQILEDLKQGNLFRRVKISDFLIEKDRIYAYQTLSDSELSIYEKLYGKLVVDRVRPDLVVYLQMSTERILENLKKRKELKRDNISPDYIDSIVEAYNRFFFHYTDTPLIIVNANNVNFERDRAAYDDLMGFFARPLHGVTYFTPQPTV